MSNASENSTRSLSEAPVVAVVERSGFVESVHRGVVVAVDADGSVLLERGDASAPSFPRSSNKPLQALAMVRAGLDLRNQIRRGHGDRGHIPLLISRGSYKALTRHATGVITGAGLLCGLVAADSWAGLGSLVLPGSGCSLRERRESELSR